MIEGATTKNSPTDNAFVDLDKMIAGLQSAADALTIKLTPVLLQESKAEPAPEEEPEKNRVSPLVDRLRTQTDVLGPIRHKLERLLREIQL